jgi:GNAT superfamily N-acetyltransferase
MRLRIAEDRLDTPASAPLVAALWSELLERYGEPDPDPDGITAATLAPPDGAFVVAWADSTAVGCGGLRGYEPAVGEVKRMYVSPAHRGQGIARAVLVAIETRARDLGYDRLVLETGLRQPEAMGLYLSAGYTDLEPYGFYRTSPLSRCFEKWL